MSTTSLGSVLGHARSLGVDRQDAEAILTETLEVDRSALIIDRDRPLDPAAASQLVALLVRCAAGEPLAYLLGSAGFHAIDLRVRPGVLVPRADTETLVDAVLARRGETPLRLLDLGSGTGAVGLALLEARPAWRLVATDLDPLACALTQENAERLGLGRRTQVLRAAWHAPFAADAFDVIVSNPPYVCDEDPDLHPDVRAHEPALALFAGADGLDAMRAILAAPPLRAGGLMALEHGHRQGEALRALLRSAGLAAVETVCDLGGRERVTLGVAAQGAGPSAHG